MCAFMCVVIMEHLFFSMSTLPNFDAAAVKVHIYHPAYTCIVRRSTAVKMVIIFKIIYLHGHKK